MAQQPSQGMNASPREVNQNSQEGDGGDVSSGSGMPKGHQSVPQRPHSTEQSTANGGSVNDSNHFEIKRGLALEVRPEGHQEGNTGGVKRADPIKEYEKELSKAWWWACGIGLMYSCSRFLALCSLTFATVVLLGAFVPCLTPVDFDFVLSLLLLEGARLSSASFFNRLLNRALAYLSQDPKGMQHDKDDHYHRSEWARNCSLIVQFIFTLPGLIMPGFRVLSGLHHYAYPPNDPNKVRNVQKSLFAFYICVFINSVVGLVNLVCALTAAYIVTKKYPEEKSILRYFDRVLKNAMSDGVVQADDFDFFDFAFTMLGGEFRRNVQPQAVAKNHKQLIHYVYANRLGVDFVRNYMDAENAFVQLAAVNMVGFWADTKWKVGVSQLRLPKELLTKLADKVGTGQVGWAATTSIGVVAASSQMGAQIVATTCNSKNVLLPSLLASLVDDSSSRSLSLVRAIGELYENLCKNETRPPVLYKGVEQELVPKLKKLAREAERHRLRVQAAYLLHMMDTESDDLGVIVAIDPARDDHWFRSETLMLNLLRRVHKLEAYPFLEGNPPKIREDREIDTPSWATRPEKERMRGVETIDRAGAVGGGGTTHSSEAIVQPIEEVPPTATSQISTGFKETYKLESTT